MGVRKLGKVIAVSNQKGGVGKTTTVVNLAAAMGLRGKKVLIIDLDPQGNTTTSLGISKKSIRYTSYEVITEQCRIFEAAVPTQFRGISVVPATKDLAGASVELIDEDGRAAFLKKQTELIRGDYDYILIDCAPSLDLLTINALTAADSALIPIQCEFLSLEGLTELIDTIKRIRLTSNPGLMIEGILFTMYVSRYKLTEQVEAEVKKYFKNDVLETVIPRSVALSEAPSFGQPIMYYDKKSKGAKAYDELAKEIIKRGKKQKS